jgi:cyclase
MTHGSFTADSPQMHEVAPGVHAWVQPDGAWFVNNAGAVVHGDAVLVVDTCATADRTRAFLDAVDRASGGADVRYAVNTHQHGDHTYGNDLLPDRTVLLGHRLMREGLRVDPVFDACPPFWSPVPDWGVDQRRLPDVTVDDGASIALGDRMVQLHHPGGPAHTTGDLAVWLPEERVLFAGDLVFAGLTPLVFMGSVSGALASVDWVAGFGPEVVVPGHGPVLTGSDIDRVLDEHRRYYRFLQDRARAGLELGRTPLEMALDTDLGEFGSWADSERIVMNLHRAYVDVVGGEVDVMAAISDAVTLNGGPLATSV